jgi:cytochrome b-561
MVASIAGMNNILADILGTTTDAINTLLIGLMVGAPLVAGLITYAVLGGFGESTRPNDRTPTEADDD